MKPVLQGKYIDGNHLQVDQWEGLSSDGKLTSGRPEKDETCKMDRTSPESP